MKIASTIDFILAMVWGIFIGFVGLEYLVGVTELTSCIVCVVACLGCGYVVHKLIWSIYKGTRVRKIGSKSIIFPE